MFEKTVQTLGSLSLNLKGITTKFNVRGFNSHLTNTGVTPLIPTKLFLIDTVEKGESDPIFSRASGILYDMTQCTFTTISSQSVLRYFL